MLPAPSPSRQYARLRDMMVDACMNVASRIARPLVRAGAAPVGVGDPLNLEVVADLPSTDVTQIETGAAVRIGGWAEQPSG